MAQPLQTRINAALQSAVLHDVVSVLTELEGELSSTHAKLDQQNARSIDPALTTPQAREARDAAADLEHDVRRLKASQALLEQKRDEIAEVDREAARQARYDAAKAERDDLALHIRARYPELAAELVAFARRIQASDAECEAATRDRPRGAAKLESAEHLARGCSNYWTNALGGGWITRIADMTLPLLSRAGMYLPASQGFDGSTQQWERLMAADVLFSKQPIAGIADDASASPADAA